MKNSIKKVMLVMLISVSLPMISHALSTAEPIAAKMEMRTADDQKLINRLNEIKNLDTKLMTRREKRNLRHEVKAAQNELARSSGGIYLSVGAILLIILILIILL